MKANRVILVKFAIFLNKLKPLGLPILILILGFVCGYSFFQDSPKKPPQNLKPDSVLKGISSIALGPENLIYLGGTFGIKVLNPAQEIIKEWTTPEEVHAVAVDSTGNIYAAYTHQVEKFSRDGISLLVWRNRGDEEFAYLTGIAIEGEDLFLADAGERMIYRFNLNGQFQNEIAGKMQDADGDGFQVPSPYFDCYALNQVLYVTDPGRLRVERYDYDGNLLDWWGKSGTKEDEFPGCCNPTHIAVFTDGRVVVSQKGDPCVKVYDSEGRLLKKYGEGIFDASTRGIDLAVGEDGNIYAVDSTAHCMRVFKADN